MSQLSLFPETDSAESANLSLGPASHAHVELAPATDDWRWWEENQNCVLPQLRTAVFINLAGDIAIRQEPRAFADDDAVVWFRAEQVPALIKRLQGLLP